jgi:Zinc finger found in FPG and IleRS
MMTDAAEDEAPLSGPCLRCGAAGSLVVAGRRPTYLCAACAALLQATLLNG